MGRRRLSAVARAISEGHPVDWDSLERQTDPDDQGQLRQLRTLAALATGRRADSNAHDPVSHGTSLARPWPWRLVVAIAVTHALLALGRVVWSFGAGAPPFPVLLQATSIGALVLCAGALIRFGQDARALNLAALLLLLASSASQPFLAGYRGTFLGLLVSGIHPDAFVPYYAWAFVRDFPRIFRFSRLDRVCAVASFVSAAAGLVLFIANIARSYGVADAVPILAALRRGGTSLYWAIVWSLLIPALGVMLARIRHAAPAERRRVALFVGGLGAGILPVVTIVSLEIVSRTFDALTSRPEVFAVTNAIVYTSILSVPFSTSYAVLVQRVLAVRVVVRKTLTYALARGTLMAATVLPLAALGVWIFSHRDLTIAELFTGIPAIGALLLAGAALILLLIRTPLLRVLDRRYFREDVDLTSVIARLADSLGEARDGRRVAEIVERCIQRALQVERVDVYREEDGRFLPVRGRGTALAVDTALATLMQTSTDAVDLRTSGLGRLLPGAERGWLSANEVAAVAPMAREETVVGFIAAGERRNDLEFTPEALAFLTTAAASATLAIGRRLMHGTPAAPGLMDDAANVPAAECERCGTVLPPVASLCTCGGRLRAAALPHVLSGKFKVISRLGAGGMGVVYRAVDLSLGRPVALKTLPRLTRSAIARLTAEAQSMARAAHPALATIHAIDSWDGAPVLVIELLDGGTLADRVRRGPMPLRDAVLVALQLASSLAHLHRHGLLHRDVKPGNIGFTAGGQLKLLDFGLAAALQELTPAGDDRTASTEDPVVPVAGTPLYLPPEAWAGASPGPAFDLWGAAVVLYEMLTGRHPMQPAGSLRQAVGIGRYGRVSDIGTALTDVPQALSDFLARALATDPERRPCSAEAFVRELSTSLPDDVSIQAHSVLLRSAGFDV